MNKLTAESYEKTAIATFAKTSSHINTLMLKFIEKLNTNVIILVNTEVLKIAYVI